MNRMHWLIFIMAMVLTGCSSETSEEMESRQGRPDQESFGVTIILSNEGIMRAKVKSGHLEKYNEKEFVLLDSDVTVDFFDENERHTSNLTSLRAEVDQTSNNMKAIGNVVAVSDSGITLYTDTLIWNSKDEKMFTNDSIKITTTESDTLFGIGFESDSDLKNWKVLKPSGVTNRGIK